MTDENATVVVPRWALEFIMDKAHLADMSAVFSEETWASSEMRAAEDVIRAALQDQTL